ncbi:hypothetical protein VCRA2119O147_250045 [Vibrio crassostreae]|nr:hypothetical protein VCRA2119O145_100007 [Vibrio crassostreae]CAK1701017.1 hypothetical protein VCRA2111O320_100090 [Vibrio crassostreae]CAK1710441.1 hypothetical protein VCRA2113O212_110006 [Vibrio crassostreae]CAK1735870.1 hypothetical protein VCRA2119O381_110051 [Vibrio crassostreae]CAK1778856.1 hypothetical protein VCRA2114O422_160045 [Vibrio crassostreae]
METKKPPRNPIKINVIVTNSGCMPMINAKSNFTSPAPITPIYQSIKNTMKHNAAVGNDDIR